MNRYEFMHFGRSVTLDYIAAELSKLVNAEVVAFDQNINGMTVLIKVAAPTKQEGEQQG
jgi:hypothetical protein